MKRALKGPTAHLHAPTAYLRHAYAHLARRCSPSRAHAAHAHAAFGAPLGGPVPPSHARARLGGCSARYRVLRGIYARLRPILPTVSYPLFVSDPWLFERAIWIDLATPVTGLGRKKRIYSRLVICLGARVW